MKVSPKSVFITGCNRGIGLELVKQFLKLETPPKNLFATCRKVSDELKVGVIKNFDNKDDNIHKQQSTQNSWMDGQSEL